MEDRAEARRETLLSDEEIRRRMMLDPEIRARVEEIVREVKEGGSTSRGWTLDRIRLRDSLHRFNATNPDAETRTRVSEWLMDLVKDVGVIFVPDMEEMKVYVAAISRVD